MNLYASVSHAFTVAARQQAETFAAQAAAGLTLVLRNAIGAEESQQLKQALANRTTIDQALGILMAQRSYPADEAFALLRATSQNSNRKLRDVAADLVTRVTGRRPVPGPPFVGSAPQPTSPYPQS